MNERIKELSEKAKDYAIEQYGPQRRGEQVWNPLTYETKFAELIVKEVLERKGDRWSDLDIKEYLGVKDA